VKYGAIVTVKRVNRLALFNGSIDQQPSPRPASRFAAGLQISGIELPGSVPPNAVSRAADLLATGADRRERRGQVRLEKLSVCGESDSHGANGHLIPAPYLQPSKTPVRRIIRMATEAQIAANRANALKSTGPVA
jgi:hypothetical protein